MADSTPPPGGPPSPDETPPPKTGQQATTRTRTGLFTKITNPTENVVERTRAWTGMWVVAAGDVAIALAAIWGVVKISGSGTGSPTVVAILTSAFTAIGTMTTAYFGIKSTANTAQHYSPPTDTSTHTRNNSGPSPS